MAVYLLLLCFSFGIVCIEGFKHRLKTIRPYDTSIFPSFIIPRRWKEPYQQSEQDRYTMQNHYSERDEYSMPLGTISEHDTAFSRSSNNEIPMSNPSAAFRHVVNITSHVEHRLVLFDRTGQAGDSVLIVEDTKNLATKNFNDLAKSVCVSGTWVLYENPNYNEGVDAGVDLKFSPPPKTCSDVKTIGGKVSSVRHVGHPFDYRTESITFYTGTNFQGKQYLIWTIAELILTTGRKVNSLIITGTSSWTVYERDNFKGKSLCISQKPSDHYQPKFVSNTASLNFPQIQSAKKGC